MTKNTKKYEVRARQQLAAPHFEHNQQIMSAKMNVLSSPSRNRATGMTSMHEVKSGIFLSDIKGGAGDVNRKKTMKVVRTKSGNFKKAMESELDGEKDFAGDAGTRVTSSYARVLLAGSGFLADAYDLFVINLVLRLLRNEYPEYGAPVGGVSLHALEGGVAAAALVGSIIGQLVAGTLADVIGRKKIFVTTAVLISIGSFGSACSGNWPQFTVYGQLACWRFLLGLGVGGEYPLAATVTSESSSAAKRGRLMAAVFSMQGVGSLLSVIIVITCLTLGCSDGFTWRFALAFGALPVMIAFPFRLRMHETESFQRVKQEREAQAVLNKETQEVIRLLNIEAPPNYGSTAPQGSPKLHYSGKIKSSKHTTSGQSTQNKETEMMHIVTDCVIQDDYLLNSSSNKNSTNKPTSTTNTNTNQFFFPAVPTSKDPLLPHTKAKTSTTTTSPKLTLNTTMDPFSPQNTPATPVLPTRMSEIHKAFKYYKFHMLGTALCWFLLDVDFYANGLFNHEITSSIFSLPGQRNTALQDAYYTGVLSIIALPGYWLSVMYIDVVGRKNLQMMGFTCMAGLFFICAIAYEWLMDPTGSMYRKYLFLLIYALTFLFSNFGPNTTSFVIPGEIFPAEVRATCHGISAASGKLGAATGAFFFPHLLGPEGATAPTTAGIRLTMLVCGIVAVLGVAVTYLFIPTYDASMLVQEGNYLALDHAFLRPCDDDLMLLDGYECVEIEESDPASANTSNLYTSSYNNYGASDGATTNETSGFEQGKGIPDRSGKYYTASNNPLPMKSVAGSHHDGYNQIQGRDELY